MNKKMSFDDKGYATPRENEKVNTTGKFFPVKERIFVTRVDVQGIFERRGKRSAFVQRKNESTLCSEKEGTVCAVRSFFVASVRPQGQRKVNF